MTEILSPFDPFTKMIERPVPKTFSYMGLGSKSTIDLNLEEGEIAEDLGSSEDKDLEEGEIIEGKIVPIFISKKEEFERESVLERLRKNKIGITQCDIPTPFPSQNPLVSDIDLDTDGTELDIEEEESTKEGELLKSQFIVNCNKGTS